MFKARLEGSIWLQTENLGSLPLSPSGVWRPRLKPTVSAQRGVNGRTSCIEGNGPGRAGKGAQRSGWFLRGGSRREHSTTSGLLLLFLPSLPSSPCFILPYLSPFSAPRITLHIGLGSSFTLSLQRHLTIPETCSQPSPSQDTGPWAPPDSHGPQR